MRNLRVTKISKLNVCLRWKCKLCWLFRKLLKNTAKKFETLKEYINLNISVCNYSLLIIRILNF